jgi:hypothetical protein
MHQWTGEQEKERQVIEQPCEVCSMLGDKKESRDQQKADKYKFPYRVRRFVILPVVMIHVDAPSNIPFSGAP